MSDKPSTSEIQAARVLVLDDDELVRKLAVAVLKKCGCEVEAAADGREGLQLLLLRDIDVAVVDLRMSGMDGLAFLNEALTICPWLGVIIVTGYIHDHAIERAQELGVKSILKKPFDLDEFRRLVFERAAEKRLKLKSPAGISLGQIQYALSLFQELGRSATEAESLMDAVRAVSAGFAFLDAHAVSILSLEEEPILVIFARADVSSAFVDDFEAEVRRRYNAFSGKDLPSGMQVEVEGDVRDSGQIAGVGACYSVPIIVAGEIRGLLALATASSGAYRETDMLFLYHAANLMGTVLLTFRRMRQLVVRDALTGLYNQRGVNEQLESIWQLGKRYHYQVNIAMLDIDHFKEVNDTYGHQIGDFVLRELAQLVRHTARASDIVGRYGGDEFVIVFPNAQAEDLRAFCERLRQAVHGHVFCKGMHDLSLTVSIGLSSSAGQDWLLLSGDGMISQADKALYLAKQRGRDQVSVWSPALGEAEVLDLTQKPPPPKATLNAGAPPRRQRGRVLIVDDEQPILDLLRRLLENESFAVATHLTAKGAAEELRRASGQFDVMLTDLTLKEDESGFDLLKQVGDLDETLVPVVMTGHATLENAVNSLRHGAYDFIRKPIDAAQLFAVLDRGVEYRRLRMENRRYQMRLEEMVRNKSRELATALEQTKASYNFTLEAMVAMLDAREHATGRHSISVRELALILGREMRLSSAELKDLGHGALLHDIGKIGIPDSILLKQGPLTSDEWAIMKTHTRIGYDMVSSSPFLAGAAEIILSHQEHYDGSGYPRGLKGEEICLGARVFAVVDAYDAMRSDRPYRRAMRKQEVLDELRRCSGTQFDPTVVDAAMRCMPQMEKVRALEMRALAGEVVDTIPGVREALARLER